MRPRPAATEPASAVTRALRQFVATELAGSVVLLTATAAALAWANSPWHASYDSFWRTEAVVGVGRWALELDLRHWVNDGLMALFFLVVGLEVKRELLQGELRERRKAVLPVAAAIGGMVVPATIYAAFNAFGDGASGWGVPMATDIAFAIGVLALVAPRIPSALRVFLLALAIVDDIGAIVVIAVFYTRTLEVQWLAAAGALIVLIIVLRRIGIVMTPVFIALGVALWIAVYASGIHAAIAGVLMGVLAPGSPRLGR